MESQCSVLKQAIGTMADAVSEEIEELKRGLNTDFESKIKIVCNQIENSKLTHDKSQVEQNKIQFELEKLKEDVYNRFPQNVIPADQTQSAYAAVESEHRFNAFKVESRKLFEQMRHIIQTQCMQAQSQARDIERLDS